MAGYYFDVCRCNSGCAAVWRVSDGVSAGLAQGIVGPRTAGYSAAGLQPFFCVAQRPAGMADRAHGAGVLCQPDLPADCDGLCHAGGFADDYGAGVCGAGK